MNPTPRESAYFRQTGTHGSLFFALAGVEAALALIVLVLIPSDGHGPLGYSPSRLLGMAVFVGLACSSLFLFQKSRSPVWQAGWRKKITTQRWLINGLFILLPLLLLVCLVAPILLFAIYKTGGDFRFFAYYERTLPFFAWGGLVSLQGFVLLIRQGDFQWQALKHQRPGFRAALVIWALFGLVWLFVAVTRIGVTPDLVPMGLPTVALLEWQVGLAWGVGLLLLLFLSSHPRLERLDRALAGGAFLLAMIVWLSLPVLPSYFATAGRAPNDEIYPFSDGAYYGHFAQSLLAGHGLRGNEVAPRPLYIGLLAVFHLVAGQAYERVIIVQTLFLALFPVVLYFLGKEIHSRPAGLTIALLAILREWTAIQAAPFTDNASNSKLFFADLPTALVVSFWLLLVVRWLKAPDQKPLLGVMVGGGLGLAMLFRTQSVFMLLPVLLLAGLILRFHWRQWFGAAALVAVGLAAALFPWLFRNGLITGTISMDDARSQTGVMAQRYSLNGNNTEYHMRPGEDAEAYAARVTQGIFRFMFEHPGIVAWFVSDHWLNAEIANVQVLPVRFSLAGLNELLVPSLPFWQEWNGRVSLGQAVMFALYLALIALGIGACWARLGWVGLVLLLANLAYNFSMALARNSGGRYLLVVDWVTYVYAAIGLLELSVSLLLVLGKSPAKLLPLLASREQPSQSPAQHHSAIGWRAAARTAALCLAFGLVGGLTPLLEQVLPSQHPDWDQAMIVQQALKTPSLSAEDRKALEHFSKQPDTRVVFGRALYPRYYGAGEGEPRTAKTGYEPLDYARTLFLVTSKSYQGLAILRAGGPPAYFPHAADVILFGCQKANYLSVEALVFEDGQGGMLFAENGIPAGCSVAE